MKNVTVVITHFNRVINLGNTLDGLSRQSEMPDSVIVVNMGDEIVLACDYPFELKIVQYPKKWRFLPLAAARNFGACLAQNGQLIFLDVDCIPEPDFCKLVSRASCEHNALIMGTPKYMLYKTISDINIHQLRGISVHHPLRPRVTELRREDCYELFWSLCFAIPSTIFHKIGGFDEKFRGYGAEDTDFALSAKKNGVPLYLSNAEVYHQQHPICVPPLNHLQSIVNNCNYYRKKWGYWPMADCLEDFTRMQLIRWIPKSDQPVEILSLPTVETIERHLVRNAPYR